jgi:hypothetical protein
VFPLGFCQLSLHTSYSAQSLAIKAVCIVPPEGGVFEFDALVIYFSALSRVFFCRAHFVSRLFCKAFFVGVAQFVALPIAPRQVLSFPFGR